ncbi:MAG: hypothetical protein ABI045_02635 [Flavobacteriales bacterium]
MRDSIGALALRKTLHGDRGHNEKSVNDRFDRVAEYLTDYGKAVLKKNIQAPIPYCNRWTSLKTQLGISSNILAIHIKGIAFKWYLVTVEKRWAVHYHKFLRMLVRF